MADLTRRATLIIQLQDQISSGAKSAAGSLDDVERRARSAAAANDQGSRSAAQHSQALQNLGNIAKGAAVAGFAALTGAIVASVKSAGEFQSSFGKIAGLTNTSTAAIEGLKASVIGMSRDLPVSANDLAKGLYYISSSGYQGAEALKILEMSAKASAAGLGETKTIADAVTSALNAYGLGADKAAKITDLLTKAVIEGKGEPAELAGSLGRVLPVAAAAGVSMEQVAASLAVMTRTGLSADEAATALRGTIGALLAPAKQSKDALANLGISTDQVAQMLRGEGGLVAVLDLLMKKTGGNVEQLDAIIPNIRALTGVLSTSGSQAAEYARVLGVMNDAAGATEKAFTAMSNTFEFKLKKAQNSVENLGIAIGNKLLPGLSDAADAATTLLNWTDKLNDAFAGASSNIAKNAQSYTEYKNAIIETGVAAGKLTRIQADLIQSGKNITGFNQEDLTPRVFENLGLMTKEQFEYGQMVERSMKIAAESGLDLRDEYAALAKAQQGVTATAGDMAEAEQLTAKEMQAQTKVFEDYFKTITTDNFRLKEYNQTQAELRQQAAGVKAELDKLTASQGALVNVQSKSKATTADVTLWTLQMADAQKKLAAATDPLKQATLAEKIETLQGKIAGATGAVTAYVDNSKKIGELSAKYDELNGKIAENAKAHEEATKRIILGFLEQRLAIDGLTAKEQDVLMGVANRFGLIDDATVKTIAAVNGVADSFDPLTGNVNEAIDRVDALTSKMLNLPTYHEFLVQITAEINTQTRRMGGEIDLTGGGGGTPAPAPKPKTPTTKPKIPTNRGGHESEGASGLNMLVPPGYPNDTYTIGVTSGERVVVVPGGRSRTTTNMRFDTTINAAPGQNINDLAQAVSVQLSRKLRGAISSGAGYAGV